MSKKKDEDYYLPLSAEILVEEMMKEYTKNKKSNPQEKTSLNFQKVTTYPKILEEL